MNKEKHLLKGINWLLILTIVGSPLFYIKSTVYPYTFSKTIFFQIGVEVLFALWLLLVFLDKKYRPKKTPLLLAGGTFFLVMLITAALGVDFWRSFWATIERAVGVFTMLHFAALGLVISSLRENFNFKRIFYISAATAFLISIIAFIQINNESFLLQESVGNRPGATFGNPSFLAGYLMFHIFLAIYFLLDFLKIGKDFKKFKKIEAIFLVGVFVVCGAALLRTQTRGDLLGLGLGFLILFLMMTIRTMSMRVKVLGSRYFYGAGLAFLVLIVSSFWITRNSDLWANVPGLSRFKDFSLESKDFLPRVTAINAAWSGFLEKPILGWGWDNFNVVYNKNYDPRVLSISYQETRFDKPHNYILEYLVVGGAPLLLAYLAFVFFACYQALKLKDRLLGNFFVAFMVAYIVRSVFLFETLGPLLVFFLFVGFIDNGYKRDLFLAEEKNFKDKKDILPDFYQKNFKILSITVLVGTLVIVYIGSISGLRANHYEYLGFNYFSADRPREGILSFKKAVSIWSPYRWFIERDYAAALTENYFYNPELMPKEEVVLAIKAMEDSTSRHPRDAYGHYALVDMYNQAADIDPENFLAAAERHAATALELSPNRQQVLFSLAKTKSLRGDIKEALRISREAMELNPDVADAHFYYGLFLHVDGQMEAGYQELKKAIELGRQWKNFHEPLVVGNFFADSGHIGEAIELYQTAEKMEPTDLEVKIKIGIAYYFNDQKSLAREKISEVMSKFDITTSPAYFQVLPILRDLGLVQ